MSKSAEQSVTDEATSGAGWKIRLSVLCAMLVLALVGMGFTQASESGSWELWLFIVLVYAALSLWRSSQSARQSGQSVGKTSCSRPLSLGDTAGFSIRATDA